MWLSVRIVKAIVLIMSTVCGISMNCSIVGEYCRCHEWRHHPGVHIFFSTAVTNVLLQFSVSLDGFLYVFSRYIPFVHEVYVMDLTLLYLLIEVSFWHATWLSVYYCLKLVHLPSPFLLQLKLRFSSIVPVLLMGSITGSLLINVPFLWTLQISLLPNETDYTFTMDYPHTICNVIFGCLFPFLITFTSIVLSVRSLLRYVMKVRSNEKNLRRPRLKAHTGAVKTMVSRLVLDLLLCLVSAGLLASELTLWVVVDTACWLFLMSYSTFQSIIVIHGNPKLRRKFWRKKK